MDKKSFLENEKQVEQDMTAKEILAERVKELGLGYEQVEVEPKVMLPTYNYLGEVDKFEAYENTVGAMQFISNPSFSAESQELSSYYLGGTFVTNTCEKMLTINPLEEPEAPESVVTEVESLDLVGGIEEEGVACIIPLENISGWDEDLSTWDKPVDENGNEIEGEWAVLNGGAVYTGGETATLTISFIPVAKDVFEAVNIEKTMEVAVITDYDLTTGLKHLWTGGKTDTLDLTPVVGDKNITNGTYAENRIVYAAGKIDSGFGCVNNITGAYINSVSQNSSKSSSLSFWIKPEEISDNSLIISSRYYYRITTVGTIPGLVTKLLNGKIVAEVWGSVLTSSEPNIIYSIESNTIIENGKWFLITITTDIETSKFSLYVNNKIEGSLTIENINLNQPITSGTIYIGKGNTSIPANYTTFKGTIDEIAIWEDRCIGEAEVKGLWNKGNGLPYEQWTKE